MYQPILFLWKFNKGAAGVVHKDEKSAKILLRHHNHDVELPGMRPIGEVPLQPMQNFTPVVLFCEGVISIGDTIPEPKNNFQRPKESNKVATDDKDSEESAEDPFTFETGHGVTKASDFGFDG